MNNERERVKKRMRESEKLIVFFFFLPRAFQEILKSNVLLTQFSLIH